MGKDFYKSKKFWTGLIGTLTGLSMYFTGEQTPQEALMTVFSGVYTVLAVFFTKEPIVGWRKQS